MVNYKFCNLILKKQFDISIDDYYKLYYICLDDIKTVKLSKNCFVFNKFDLNVKIFVNGIVTLTGIKLKTITKDLLKNLTNDIENYIISNITKDIEINDLHNYNDLYILNQKFLLNKDKSFIGLKIDKQLIIHNIVVKPIIINGEYFYMSCNNNNKHKKIFKDGKYYGTLSYTLFNSKNFFNNSTVNIDYENKCIYSKEKLIGDISIKKQDLKKKVYIDNSFSIVSCNIQFNIDKNINRYKLFDNLINKGYVAEYKLFSSCSVNLFYDNTIVSVFKSGNVIVKGISNNSNIDNIDNYISTIYNIISLNF